MIWIHIEFSVDTYLFFINIRKTELYLWTLNYINPNHKQEESYFRNPLLLLSFAAYNCIKVICRVFRLRHKCPVIKVKFKSDNCRNCRTSSGLEHLFLSVNTSDLNLAHWLCRKLHPIVECKWGVQPLRRQNLTWEEILEFIQILIWNFDAAVKCDS